jgi:hypothetical protein
LDEQKGYELMKPGDLVRFLIGPETVAVVSEIMETAYFVWRDLGERSGENHASTCCFDLPVHAGCKNVLCGRDVYVYCVLENARVCYFDHNDGFHALVVEVSALRLLDV